MNIFVADKGYDSEALKNYIVSKGGESVIPKRNHGQDIDKENLDWCTDEVTFTLRVGQRCIQVVYQRSVDPTIYPDG